MNTTIICFLLSIPLLFLASFIIVNNYKTLTTKKKKKIASYSRGILNTIAPNNNSKSLTDFVRFLDEDKPKRYTLKGNKYE